MYMKNDVPDDPGDPVLSHTGAAGNPLGLNSTTVSELSPITWGAWWELNPRTSLHRRQPKPFGHRHRALGQNRTDISSLEDWGNTVIRLAPTVPMGLEPIHS